MSGEDPVIFFFLWFLFGVFAGGIGLGIGGPPGGFKGLLVAAVLAGAAYLLIMHGDWD